MKRTTLISIRFSQQDLDELEKMVISGGNPNGKYKSVSAAVRNTTSLGLQVLQYQEMMKDPAKSAEFCQKMKEFIKNDQIFEWAQTLDTQQLDGFVMLLQMEKENRYVQKKFL